jgi:2-polyprenyl-3-methyl-5-hydroxy-6-metoxy-1,4-benzoquinol methylase
MVPADGRVIGSIGCGMGATERVLVEQGREVLGVDISPEAIAVASKRLTKAWVVSPDDMTPFAPESLDGLILADVIEHLPMARERLASFTRAVRPGGWVVISVPNMRCLKVLLQFEVRGDWPEHSSGIFDRTHVQMMSAKRLERWCDDAGLVIEKWFDRYLADGWRKRILQTVDYGTFRLFRHWMMFQLQVRGRRIRQGT